METEGENPASEQRLVSLEAKIESLTHTIRDANASNSDSVIGERLEALEGQVSRLKDTFRPGETPAAGIFGTIAFVCFVLLMAKLPLPIGPDAPGRFAVGIASLIGGGLVFAAAAAFVDFSFKVLVELATACVISLNIAIGAVAWSCSPQLYELASIVQQFLIEKELVQSDVPEVVPFGAILLVIAAIMFLVNAMFLLVLIPAGRVAGVKL